MKKIMFVFGGFVFAFAFLHFGYAAPTSEEPSKMLLDSSSTKIKARPLDTTLNNNQCQDANNEVSHHFVISGASFTWTMTAETMVPEKPVLYAGSYMPNGYSVGYSLMPTLKVGDKVHSIVFYRDAAAKLAVHVYKIKSTATDSEHPILVGDGSDSDDADKYFSTFYDYESNISSDPEGGCSFFWEPGSSFSIEEGYQYYIKLNLKVADDQTYAHLYSIRVNFTPAN